MACLLWEDSFYESGESIVGRIRGLCAKVSPEIVSGLAIEARHEMHLRHVPLLLARELARGGGKIVGDTLSRVISRPDEFGEFLALYWQDGRVPLSAQVKKGLARAMAKFDEYSLAKWDKKNSSVRLRDVMRLVHPVPGDDDRAELYRCVVKGELKTPDTWEVALSSGEDKKAVWERLLAEGKLGALALLRNLRGMDEVGVDRNLVAEAVSVSRADKVLPFRFIAAATHAPWLEKALEGAMFRSIADHEKLEGLTALVVDHSGSMSSPVSRRSTMSRFDAACGLAVLLKEICEVCTVVAFSDTAWEIPERRGMALRDALRQGRFYSTRMDAGIDLAKKLGYHRIVVFTDEQAHRAVPGPGVGRGYMVNVSTEKNGVGYGAWTHIDGFSEGIVKYIVEAERS
jgi:hypothetical protein